jgi:outer membrane protein OmpA-like peptidoglycan-associated protein
VLFTSGRADLKVGAASNLNRLVTFLNQNPDRKVEIEGHTDNVGGDDYNQGLSQRRAESVKSYLTQQGIDSERIAASGKGEHQPVADNESEGGRQQNRRVEVIIENPPVVAST